MKTGTLYIIATPIGNLADVSERAQETLRAVSLLACEDTRVTGKLLQKIGASPKLMAIHEHSEEAQLKEVIEVLRRGEDVGYVSDAGTPGISDPGGKLADMAHRKGIRVVPIPGASAMIAALSVSGFPSNEFSFLGFAPVKKGRKTFFEHLAQREETIVLFESKHRIHKTLAELPQDRAALVARELTKLHETLYRGTIAQIRAELSESAKGEFVIVLAPKHWKL